MNASLINMSDRFDITETSIPGLKLILRKPKGDRRGYLERLFCSEEFRSLLPDGRGLVQINHTLTTTRGAVRGMHFQYPPHAEFKFVSCVRGEVFDVAVDLRRESPSFLQWHGEVLSAENHKTLLIPEGFAHGFQVLKGDSEMLYFHTASYQPTAEGGLNPRDPKLAIQWPEAITELSERDASHPILDDQFAGVAL